MLNKEEVDKLLISIVKDRGKVPTKAELSTLNLPSYSSLLRMGIHLKDYTIYIPEVPKALCPTCGVKEIVKGGKFCGSSCAATFNNKLRVKKPTRACFGCQKETDNPKYCSNACQRTFEYKEYIESWKAGHNSGIVGQTARISKHIRRYLLDKANNACEQCGWNKKHPIDGLPLVEIDHIDGNALNNREDNLRVLCPNCHSMTATFRARNKISSRIRN